MSPTAEIVSTDAVTRLEAEIRADAAKLNNIVALLAVADGVLLPGAEMSAERVSVGIAAVHALYRVYADLMPRLKAMPANSTSVDKVKEEVRAKETALAWLRDTYTKFVASLLARLSLPVIDGDATSQRLMVTALKSLMDLVRCESRELKVFAGDLFLKVVDAVLAAPGGGAGSDGASVSASMTAFQKFYIGAFDDIRFFFFRDATNIMKRARSESPRNTVVSRKRKRSVEPLASKGLHFAQITCNMYHALTSNLLVNGSCSAALPQSDNDITHFMCPESASNERVVSLHGQRRKFSEVWLAFLRMPHLTPAMYKAVLSRLDADIVPHMVDPRLLHDFLTDSYDQGGVTSLLALNALFTLIHKHNLDYPQFYTKLYALFDANMLHTKHRARFLKLASVFLKSSHLPAYLVAAFVKRMARLALFASPAAILSVLPLMYNLLHRNASCLPLIHRIPPPTLPESELSVSASEQQAATDCYLFAEPDPAKCNALDSSLWELQVLSEHYLGAVSNFAKRFQKPIDPKQPALVLEPYFDNTWAAMIEQELGRSVKKAAPLATGKSAQLFAPGSFVAAVCGL